MSLDQLKDQIVSLTPEEQRELIAFAISLQTERDVKFRRHLADRINDADSRHWIELDDLTRKLRD